MTHIDENNYAATEFDILASELIKTNLNSNEKSRVIIISPWMKDYAIPVTWPSFTSNFINITDMQTSSDILTLLMEHGVDITVVTIDPKQLEDEKNWSTKSVRETREFCGKITDGGGNVIYTKGRKYNHGKLTWTSEHALIGSGNFTSQGRNPTWQLNVGELIIKSKDARSHEKKRTWALKSIEDPENEPDAV